jgi:hypothetical protein
MARNKIEDLNNHLFAALERLDDDELTGEALTEEIERAKAVVMVGGKVIDAMKVQSDLFQAMLESGYHPSVPEQFRNMLAENNS